jgi:hypothetical protein
MTQYLVAIHHADDYDPSAEDEAISRDIEALNDEIVAAGVGFSLAASPPPAARGRCGRGPMVKFSSPTGRTWRPRSTSAVFGCWKPLIRTMQLRGGARLLSPVGRPSMCARLGGPTEATERQ